MVDKLVGFIGGVCYSIVALIIIGIAFIIIAGLWVVHPAVGLLALTVILVGAWVGWRDA